MSIDNAVFALAGTMILASLALAQFVSPWFLLLTAFVGVNMLQAAFTGFCPAALNAAFRFGQPQIWNSDQGPQFTAAEFLAPLKARSIFCPNEGGHLSFVGRHTIVPL